MRGRILFLIVVLWPAMSCSVSPPEGMVIIPAGPFTMGSDKVDHEGLGQQLGLVRPLYVHEHPERRVELKTYFIGRFEVTNREFLKFVEATGAETPPDWKGRKIPAGLERHPVGFVSWYDADRYCRWRGGRLPTEAEWEKAARGVDGREYPWGNTFDSSRLNTGEAPTPGPSPVGSFPQGRSPYGVEDLAGNVGEWVDDWYLPYPGNTVSSPLFGQRFKVIRGGSWGGQGGHYALVLFYRSAHRLFGDPVERYPDTGFRCAKDG
jgi:formylglycine-generating enzyme required for sulfatase activity